MWYVFGVASFSSSLRGLFVFQGFRVTGWLRGLRDGSKSTTAPRDGQAPRAAQPEGRPVDDIDDADDIDDPRTEGRRRRVRLDSGTPKAHGRPKAEGATGFRGHQKTHGRPKAESATCGGG